MAPQRRRRKTTKKKPEFELDVDTRFEVTGRGTTKWFSVFEEDDYGKIGGNFFPDDPERIASVVADLLEEAQEQINEAGIEASVVDPVCFTEDNEIFYRINRKGVKANGDEAIIKFRDITGRKSIELDDELGNGSVVNIKYYASAYYMAAAVTAGVKVPARIGVTLGPLVVQVIDHKLFEEGAEFDDMSSEYDDALTDEDAPPFDTEQEAPKTKRKTRSKVKPAAINGADY